MQCDGTETVATAALLPPRKEPGAGTSAPNSCASDIAIALPEGRSQTVFRQAADLTCSSRHVQGAPTAHFLILAEPTGDLMAASHALGSQAMSSRGHNKACLLTYMLLAQFT